MDDNPPNGLKEAAHKVAEEIVKDIGIEAIRVKHEVNQRIQYGELGMNAKQVKSLWEMNTDSWKKLSEEIKYINKSWFLLPQWLWKILSLFSFLLCSYLYIFNIHQYIFYGSILIFILSTYHTGYLKGHNYGYIDGFQSGHINGVNASLGITLDDEKDIHERATEMEIDEVWVKALDKHKSK